MWLKYAPATLLVSAVAATNLQFAWTLGDTTAARAIFVAYSVAATLGTALGPHFAADNWNAGRRLRAACALLCFAMSITYDVYSTKGFAARERTIASDTTGELKRRRAAADDDVKRLTADLAAYANAPDSDVAKSEADNLQSQLDEIDKQPGVSNNDAPCVRVSSDRLRELCAKRAKIAPAALTAKTAVARAAAKQRIEFELASAQRALTTLPLPNPSDDRSVREWLPVGLALAAALSVFAVPPKAAEPAPERPCAPVPAEPGVPRRRRNQAGKAAVAAKIAELSSNPAKGLVVDRDGFLRGSQRNLARAAGYGSNVSGFNRDLRAAADEGELELETGAGGTAVRPKAPA